MKKKLEFAILVTEGAIFDIVKNDQFKIVQLYVESPLQWGIHVSSRTHYQSLEDIRGKKIAISRYGSGSHIVSFLLAEQEHWNIESLQFVVVNDLVGAREALQRGDADIFLWEKVMTQPYVDNGEFRRIGVISPPWPSFVLAVRNDILLNYAKEVKVILDEIKKISSEMMQNKGEELIQALVERYQLPSDHVRQWLEHIIWSTEGTVSDVMLENVMDTLLRLKLIEEKKDVKYISYQGN